METQTKEIIKNIVNRRTSGVYLNGEYCPVKYHVGNDCFYVAFSGKILSCRRNTLIAMLLEEADRMERYSKLLLEETK